MNYKINSKCGMCPLWLKAPFQFPYAFCPYWYYPPAFHDKPKNPNNLPQLGTPGSGSHSCPEDPQAEHHDKHGNPIYKPTTDDLPF